MLFNLQNLSQTEDNEARQAEYKDLLGMKEKKKVCVGETEKTKQKVVDYSAETKLLDPLQQLSNYQPFSPTRGSFSLQWSAFQPQHLTENTYWVAI